MISVRTGRFFFLSLSLFLFLATFLWSTEGGSLQLKELPHRIFLSAPIIFLFPGLFWGGIFGFRSRHPLETVSISFALTLAIEIIILIFLLCFRLDIRIFLFGIYAVVISGIAVCAYRQFYGASMPFIWPLETFFIRKFWVSLRGLNLLLILFMSFGTYRWGENTLGGIGGEEMLYLSVARRYFSGPLNLTDLGIGRLTHPPNFVHLWEFLVAAWAKSIHSDLLPVAFRARFLIPILGLSSMYLLIRSIFVSLAKSEAILFGVLLACLGGFGLLTPSSLDWIKQQEPLRGLLSFMGTMHHADSAMEILLCLTAAFVLRSCKNFQAHEIIVALSLFVACFLWHAREFFQELVYFFVLGITLIVTQQKKTIQRNWLILFAGIIIISASLLGIAKAFPVRSDIPFDEFGIKAVVLKNWLSLEHLFGFRSLFTFPEMPQDGPYCTSHLTSIPAQHLWLVLSSFFGAYLLVFGGRRERIFSTFFFLLWLLALNWDLSIILIKFGTYSEFYITPPRIIYLFSFLIIFAALFHLATKIGASKLGRVGLLAFGAACKIWWSQGSPLIPLLSIAAATTVIVAALIRSMHILKFRTQEASGRPGVICFLIFLTPLLSNNWIKTIRLLATERTTSTDWFGVGNPLKMSPNLISALRVVPPRKNFLVDPLSNSLITIYADQFLDVVPYLPAPRVADGKKYESTRAGSHPVFIGPERSEPDHLEVLSYIKEGQVTHILVRNTHYSRLKPYFLRHPESYRVAFDNPKDLELIVENL